MLRKSNHSKGTIGSMHSGNKPSEILARKMYGIKTQGQCNGSENCQRQKCDHYSPHKLVRGF